MKNIIYIFLTISLMACSKPDKVFESSFSNGGVYNGLRVIELYSNSGYVKIEHLDEKTIIEKGNWEGLPTDGNSFSLIPVERNGKIIQGKIEVYDVRKGKAGLDYSY